MIFLTAPNLAGLPIIRHGFFGRSGGVSKGLYASLNCGFGSGDAIADVTENRARVAAMLGAVDVFTCYQVHSNIVVNANVTWKKDAAPQADALVTNQAGIALGVLTADCAPLLLLDAEAGVIAAAHAGWKGAFTGIVEATIEAMEQLGAKRSRIIAAIGPCIQQASYEVGDEFRERILASSPLMSDRIFIAGRSHHWQFNLPCFVQQKLTQSGVMAINSLANDTCSDENQWFSYRRATLNGESVYGRQMSAIMLTKNG